MMNKKGHVNLYCIDTPPQSRTDWELLAIKAYLLLCLFLRNLFLRL